MSQTTVEILEEQLNQVIKDSQNIEKELEDQLCAAEKRLEDLLLEIEQVPKLRTQIQDLEVHNESLTEELRIKDETIANLTKLNNSLYEKLGMAEANNEYTLELEKELDKLKEQLRSS